MIFHLLLTGSFIVAHFDYGYWENAYELKRINKLLLRYEPSQKKLEKIIKTAEQDQINYVLFE